MNPEEYQQMAAVEQEHWWYRGLRGAIAAAINQKRFALPEQPNVLDAGCGTGGNLRFLADLIRPSYLGGFDLYPQAVEMANRLVPEAEVYESDICDPELRADQLDLILSCDVIYIPGIAAALPGLLKLVDHLRPGGLLIVNLPAYNWLYSEHDVAIHTSERYTARRVRALLKDLGLSVKLMTYRMFLLFPAVVLARLPSMVRRKPPPEDAKSDVELPSPVVNRLLESTLRLENSAIRAGVRFPFGSSVFAVGQKEV